MIYKKIIVSVMEMDKKINQKKESLISDLKTLDSLLIAFSGGVDSSFLLVIAHQVIGENVLAATASSATYPYREQIEAIEFVKKRGIRHIIFKSDEVNLPEFASNSPERCYYCKKLLSFELKKIADEQGINHIALASNMDDLGDYRPGMEATREMGIIEPLIKAQLTKEEIRYLSKEMGLPTWDKPAMACLASRIPYGEPVTQEKLKMVEEAENLLIDRGFDQCRVRHFDSIAKIEVHPNELLKIIGKDIREEIVRRYREIGFLYVTIDLEGYVTGSLNRFIQ